MKRQWKRTGTVVVMAAAAMAAGVVQAQTVFQVDLNKTGDGDSQAGWSTWATSNGNNGPSLSNTFAGIGVTVTAGGAGGYLTARGGSSDSRSTGITGTSWNDMVEDLWYTTSGDGSMTIALTSLTPGTVYKLTAWHNDSYIGGYGAAYEVGSAITPSVTLGTLFRLPAAGAMTDKEQVETLTDADFDTSVIHFTPDGTGAATIRLDSASSAFLLVISGFQLEVVPEDGTVFQVDMNMAGDGDHQAGWSSWAIGNGNNGSSLSDVFGGIGVTVTATGAGGYLTARGGSSVSRSTSITGTSWNDMVEDLWAAVSGDGDVTIALTGLTSGTTYELTAWHNDSYSVNAGYATEVGYAVTPSVALGTLLASDAGASSNNKETDTLTDASFDTSVVSFKPDGTGAATIDLAGASTIDLFALSGFQLEVVPEEGTVFQVDMNMAGDGDNQAGWSSWAIGNGNNGSSLSDVFGGIGVTVTATGAGGYLTARGGSSVSRSTSITGTSWNDMVEDLWAAVSGDGDVTIALTGLTSGTTYELTAWHNDSYSVNAGYATEVGYAVTPSVALGTLLASDAGASSNNKETDTLTDASFDTSVVSFKPDGTGAATIDLAGASTIDLFALSGLQLGSAPPQKGGSVIVVR